LPTGNILCRRSGLQGGRGLKEGGDDEEDAAQVQPGHADGWALRPAISPI